MGDISTWNPVDASNNAAPPDGWPENQPPNTVNNCARAMMGAVRRWYDTVTAQLATYLPLTGGTITGSLGVTGGVTAASMHSTGGLTVDGATTLAGVNAVGVTATSMHSTGGLTVDGATTLAGVNAVGVTATSMHSTGGLTVDGNASVVGTITAGGNITAPAFIGNVTVPANGPVSTGGTVTGGQLTSTGNISAAGTVTAAQLTSTGNINASGNIAGANLLAGSSVYVAGNPALSVTTAGRLDILTPSGDLALILYGNPTWQNSYFNNTHQFGNSGRDFTYATFGIAGTFNQSGTWGTLSDAALKDDVAPYERGLDAILELSPISFRYQAHTPFADPERTLRYGLMAQDVAGIIPEMVGETTLVEGQDAVGTVFPGHLVFVLVNAAKELAAQNAALAARIEALEGNHV